MEKQVEIIEIAPREGLQYHEKYINIDQKVALINMLFDIGFSKVETTSFVHPKTVPQMKDAIDVFRRIKRGKSICQVLVPNEMGCRNAVACKADEIVVWTFLTEELTYHTQKRSRGEVLKEIGTIVEIAELNEINVSAYIGGAFGYPGMDSQLHHEVKALATKLIQLGCYQVCLNDEFCATNPCLTKKHLRIYMDEIDSSKLAVHFHDNRGLGLANVFCAYEEGIRSFKCSLGGAGAHMELNEALNGKKTRLNYSYGVPTEDLAYMFEEMGVKTGLKMDSLLECGRFFESLLGKKLHSYILSNDFSIDTLRRTQEFSSNLFSSNENENRINR